MTRRGSLTSIYCLILLCLCLTACSNDEHSSTPTVDDSTSSVTNLDSTPDNVKGSRDNTPHCLVPDASGTDTIGNESVTIDISHNNEGYICISYSGDSDRPRTVITTPTGITYQYELTKGGCDVFPLTDNNGAYNVAVYELISGDEYSVLFRSDFDVNITNEFLAYLYPNQYVNFDKDTKAVALSSELVEPCNSDLEAIQAVYNYVIANITYDYDKASSVESTYIPNIDKTLQEKKGICFDFASLMATMLRSQNIPTRLEIGYAGDTYHAWISTYVEDVGWVNGIIEFNGKDWEIMDPTLATTTSEDKLRNFIKEGDNYVTKYMY